MSKKALIVTRVSGFVPQFEMNNVNILKDMGYEIHYAANYEAVVYGKDNKRLMNTGIKRHHIPFVRSPFSREVVSCYKRLKQLMLQEEFDLIHCHMPMTGVLARQAAKAVYKKTNRKIPVLYTAHGFHFYKGAPLGNWMYYFLEKYYARFTDRLILINEEDFQRGKKFKVRGKVEHIPGIGMKTLGDMEEGFDVHQAYNIPKENKIVVSVGELTTRKNHETVIKAMDWFRKDPVTYIICGTGPLQGALEKMVQEMHLEKKVIFAGYCTNVSDILRQADIFAFPSKQEGLPVAVMEAMQAGLPVLALNIRGNNELIRDGLGGFLFDEDLVEDYVRGIHYFLMYPDEGERMGKCNKENVQKFSIEHVDKEMRRIYAEVEREALHG